MTIKVKVGGSYTDPAGIFVKKAGVYSAISGLSVKVGGAYALASNGAFVATRGTNLAMPFMYGIAADGSNLYGTNVYSPTWAASTKLSLGNIKSAGNDHVRLNFQPGPFLEAIKNGNTSRLNQLFAFITTAIDDCLAAGLNVFLTPHTNTENPLWTPTIILASLGAAEYGYYKTLLIECANRYKSYSSGVLSLSLFNEPPSTVSAATWQTFAHDLYDAVRAVMPSHTLMVTGANDGSLNGMLALSMAHFDANTRPTFHFYEPAEFTFQNQSFTAWKYITTGLPWPVPATTLATHLSTAKANIDADGTLTAPQKTTIKAQYDFYIPEEYGWYSRVKIIARFADAARWAVAQGIDPARIYLGEFGCNDALNITHQAAWFQDVRQGAEAYGIAWATFVWDAANYKISDGAGVLKSGLTTALYGTITPNTETATIIAAMSPAPSAVTALAIDKTVQHLKDTSIWSTGGSFVVPIAHSQQAALVDWISPARTGTTTGTLSWVADKYVAGTGASYRNTGYRLGASGSKFRTGDATIAYFKVGGPDGDNDMGNLNGNVCLSRQTGYAAMCVNSYTLSYPGMDQRPPSLANRGFLAGVSSAAGSYVPYDWRYNALTTITGTDAEDQSDLALWRTQNGYSTARIGAAWAGSKLTADQVRVLGINFEGYANFKNALWS